MRVKLGPESRNRFDVLSSDDEEFDEAGQSPQEELARQTTTQTGHAENESRSTGQVNVVERAAVSVAQVGQESALPMVPPELDTRVLHSAPQMQLGLDAALADGHAWGWDTMASSCCSGNRARFVALRRCPAIPVKVADGSIVEASHIGSVALRVPLDNGRVVRIVIENVLYHKRFASNLLSGELLTSKAHGWEYHSAPEGTYVITPGGDRATLSRRGRVSVLFCVEPELNRTQSALAVSGAGPGVLLTPAEAVIVERLVRLHECLNHMGWTRTVSTVRSGAVEDLGVQPNQLTPAILSVAEKRVRHCLACLKGRATRTPFGHRGLDRGRRPAECLHMDSYPVKVPLPDGRIVVEYGLAVKCMYTAHAWHGRFQSKDLIASAVVSVVQMIETQYGHVVKRIYADGGTEFINRTLKTFCEKHGKLLKPTPARSQQLNGAAERTVRTVKDYETMMMVHAGAPMRLWGYAGTHAAYVWNRTHVAKETQMTPYEAMFGRKPSAKHLSVWGCDAFCHIPKEQRDGALGPRAQPCIYLGHNDSQNAANVLLLGNQKVICSRDVTFRSDSFTFMRALDRGSDELREALAVADAYSLSEIDDGRTPPDA